GPLRGGLRAQRRCPAQPAAAQDRGRPPQPGPDQDRTRRRLRLRGDGGARVTPRVATSRLWPGDMAGRLALILLAGLLVVQAVGALSFLHERGYADREARAVALAEQVVAVVRLMEATPPDQRPALLR